MVIPSDLKCHARLGLVHHMLYARCTTDPDYHVRTLEQFVNRTDIETFDCCLPYGVEREKRVISAIRASGKQNITFATHLFPLRKLSFSSASYAEQYQARIIVKDMIRQATAIGATGFIFASGGPAFRDATDAHHQAFLDFCRWLCEGLAKANITALLEPFDFDVDKCFLYGPLDRNLELVARLAQEFPNIGIELDIAHLPLMREDIVSAIERSSPWLQRVHLGNCVTRDARDPFFGDKHPPIGYKGGDIDTPELERVLMALRGSGYLSTARRGDLVLELNPFPGMSEDESVADNLARVQRAWESVSAACAASENRAGT